MGFFGSLLKGVTGAATGLLSGGPVGAIAGGIAGLASGGGGTTSSSGSGTTASSQYTELRPFTAAEQSMYDQAVANIQSSGKPLTDLEKQQLRERIFQASYQPQATAINQSFDTAQAQGYANAARRGAGFNSATNEASATREASRAQTLGQAANQATLNAEQMIAQEQEQRRLAVASALDQLNTVWNQRLSGSKIVNTGSTSQTQNTTQPDSFWQTAAGAVGQAITDKDSWWNKRKKSTTGTKTAGGGSFFSAPSTFTPSVPSA